MGGGRIRRQRRFLQRLANDADSDVKAGARGVAVLRELRYSRAAVYRAADLPGLLREHGSAAVRRVFCIAGHHQSRWGINPHLQHRCRVF